MDAIKFDPSSTVSARKSLTVLRRQLENNLMFSAAHDESSMTFEQRQSAIRQGFGRNQLSFNAGQVIVLALAEVLRVDNGGSTITRGAANMANQAVAASELLDKATEVLTASLSKFNQVSDNALNESKKRVSQITDYNNRLATSLANLNKTLGDERMARAVENAEKIVTALTLLDELEKAGRLEKIMAAIK